MVTKNHYEMYDEAGNEAVAKAVEEIKELAKDRSKIYNRDTLRAYAIDIIDEVETRFSEVYDTEPRNHICHELDKICQEYGWSHNEYQGYF